MINLTFGEQVKIVLSRKDMTIKELAEEIEARTGKKMSRQNLTQRLGRDNFQEQDMRMIADILGCPFQLSILGNAESENISGDGAAVPTVQELEKLAERKERKAAREEAKQSAERDITVGEFVDMLEDTDEENPASDEEEFLTEEEAEPYTEADETVEISAEEAEALDEESREAVAEAPVADEQLAYTETPVAEAQTERAEEPVYEEESMETAGYEAPQADENLEEEKHSPFSKITRLVTPKKEKKSSGWPQDFRPIRHREDIEEDLVNGDVNPYTGHEYQSNSVRMHPHRIGYVQVYDRKDHKWTDMTEWAFLGVEERKKAAMGKEYEPPIYLD